MFPQSLVLKTDGAVDGEGHSSTKLIESLANPLSNAPLPKFLRRLITQTALDLIELVVGHHRVLLQLVLPIRFHQHQLLTSLQL